MSGLLEGKKAIVTGGFRGNGKGIAEGMISHGADVVVIDLQSGDNDKIKYYVADLRNKEDIKRVYDQIITENGSFDILVNDAGITKGTPAEDYPYEDWIATLEVNLTAPFLLSQHFAKTLIAEKKKGSIINITSLSAKYGFPNNPAYCASKGGLRVLGRQLALDWGQYGIRVNNVSPGYVRTDMTKGSYGDPVLREERTRRMIFDRWAEPEDLAGACIFLASDLSSYITGQDIIVDGGWEAKGL
jgi:NAD(P)-dependent dehydrogenase (short-subunit alcohol dehydrogenase family)